MENNGCINCRYFRIRDPEDVKYYNGEEYTEFAFCIIREHTFSDNHLGLVEGDVFPGIVQGWDCSYFKEDLPSYIRDWQDNLCQKNS